MIPEPVVSMAVDIEALERKLKMSDTAEEYARLFVEVRQYLDALDDQWKRLTAIRDSLAYEKIPKALEDSGVKSFTLKEGYRVTMVPLVRASCRNMEKAIQWMKKSGNEALVKETINASTLAAFAKDLMQTKNKELPDDIFNVYFGSNTSLTKL